MKKTQPIPNPTTASFRNLIDIAHQKLPQKKKSRSRSNRDDRSQNHSRIDHSNGNQSYANGKKLREGERRGREMGWGGKEGEEGGKGGVKGGEEGVKRGKGQQLRMSSDNSSITGTENDIRARRQQQVQQQQNNQRNTNPNTTNTPMNTSINSLLHQPPYTNSLLQQPATQSSIQKIRQNMRKQSQQLKERVRDRSHSRRRRGNGNASRENNHNNSRSREDSVEGVGNKANRFREPVRREGQGKEGQLRGEMRRGEGVNDCNEEYEQEGGQGGAYLVLRRMLVESNKNNNTITPNNNNNNNTITNTNTNNKQPHPSLSAQQHSIITHLLQAHQHLTQLQHQYQSLSHSASNLPVSSSSHHSQSTTSSPDLLQHAHQLHNELQKQHIRLVQELGERGRGVVGRVVGVVGLGRRQRKRQEGESIGMMREDQEEDGGDGEGQEEDDKSEEDEVREMFSRVEGMFGIGVKGRGIGDGRGTNHTPLSSSPPPTYFSDLQKRLILAEQRLLNNYNPQTQPKNTQTITKP